ncbi:hypothetical protein S2L_07 [Cyanophage S-2L]|nr:hypothetical protein S2L_07 [Cyanophage S-2L]
MALMPRDPYDAIRESAPRSAPTPGVLEQMSALEDLLQQTHNSTSRLWERLEPVLSMEPPMAAPVLEKMSAAPVCPMSARLDHQIEQARELVRRLEILADSIRL